MRLPRWLDPWREARNLRQVCGDYRRQVDRLNGQLGAASVRVAYLEDELRKYRQTTDEDGELSTQLPDFVLVGIPRPGAGVRVWASRKLAGTRFGMTGIHEPPPRWKITAVLDQPLTVDKPDYAQAMAHVGTVWANWDRDAGRSDRADVIPPRTPVTGRPRMREIGQDGMRFD